MSLRTRKPRRLGTLTLACALALGAAAASSEGSASAAPGGWSTDGVRILDPSGSQFVITGINWYGFETNGFVAQGMYAKNYTYILDRVKQYGYNTVRIPFSNQMWEKNPVPRANTISACPSCKGTHSRDILANIVNYAGSIGLHVILDNHRSTAGNSAETNGLWYVTGGGSSYPEQSWISDWQSIQRWLHGERQTLGSADTVAVRNTASDGFPTVLGLELRNEPHTPPRTAYLKGSTWGTGDGNGTNPNPFSPSCVSSSSCHDWRLAAERAADTVLGDAAKSGWDAPLMLVNGISQYPQAGGTAADGPYDYYWWGGDLQGVKGNSTNPAAPIRLNAGGNAQTLGPQVTGKLVYTAHDFGPDEYAQGYFKSNTCYKAGCSPNSLADVWNKYWAYLNAEQIAPVLVSEFGTGNTESSLTSKTQGSQGQWFTDMVNFLDDSYKYRLSPGSNPSGIGVTDLSWTYWALNTEDSYALLGRGYAGLADPRKEYTFLCQIQRGPLAVPAGTCGSTGALPAPSP